MSNLLPNPFKFIVNRAGIVPKFQDELDAVCAMLHEHGMVDRYALIGSAMYLPDPNDVDLAVLTDRPHRYSRMMPQMASKIRPSRVRFTCMQLADSLLFHGWQFCDDEYLAADNTWTSVRKGNVNLMLTHEIEFFTDYVRAMEVCKALKLQSKRDRILVCKIVRDHLTADDALKHPQTRELDSEF